MAALTLPQPQGQGKREGYERAVVHVNGDTFDILRQGWDAVNS